MSPEILRQIMPLSGARADVYAEPLTDCMIEFGIDSSKRMAAFLAQVCHESGSLVYTEEIADGHLYEGRVDLGNTQKGDGRKYKGRGLLQCTGRANYAACGAALGLDLINNPSLLALPQHAARSAGWFWKSHNLNQFADTDKFGALTKAINGGYNGLDERIGHWLLARRVLGL